MHWKGASELQSQMTCVFVINSTSYPRTQWYVAPTKLKSRMTLCICHKINQSPMNPMICGAKYLQSRATHKFVTNSMGHLKPTNSTSWVTHTFVTNSMSHPWTQWCVVPTFTVRNDPCIRHELNESPKYHELDLMSDSDICRELNESPTDQIVCGANNAWSQITHIYM